ncbi:MAG: hypothetical protein QF733_01255 [Phycisphaerales bacterium]|jgi:hypothetical protein|nr:hypothetical protein [Phycisphaerales bacterium]
MADSGTASLDPAIRRLASRAARRLTLNAALRHAARAGVVVSAVAVLLACVERFGGFDGWPWGWIAGAMAVIVCGAGVVGGRGNRASLADGAVVLDERQSLHDALSTALMYEGAAGPIAEAQRAAAGRAARRSGRVAGVVPLRVPQAWWAVAVLTTTAVGVATTPSLFGQQSAPATLDLAEATIETEAALADMQAALDAAPELRDRLGAGQLDAGEHRPADAAQLRQDALQSLTDLQKALDDFALDPAQQRLAGLRGRLEDLEQATGDSGGEARTALADGDFQRAAEAMDAMRAAGGESQARAFDQLARDLDAASEGDDDIRKMLQDAGVAAEEGQTLAGALQDAEHLDDDSRRSLEDLIEADRAARRSLQKMGQDCREAASACRGGDGDSDGSLGQSACRQIAEDQKAQEQAGACKSACARSRAAVGQGLGGGRAPAAADAPTDVATAVKAATEVDATAPIVTASPVAGPLHRGDTSEAGSRAMAAAQRRVQRGIDVQRIPKRYREAVAAWFKLVQTEPEDADGPDDAAEPTEAEPDPS